MSRGGPSLVRLWIYRLLLIVAAPACCLAAAEAILRLTGYGRPTAFLIPDAAPGYFRTNPDFCRRFLPDSFDLHPLNFRVAHPKPAGTIRIVLIGESAAQGVPAPTFALGPQLRAQLRARYPGTEVEVINTGIVAINSHVCYQIARELAQFQPDLFVVYMGNNEVVGPYGPGCAYLSSTPPLAVIRASVWVRSLRIGQAISDLLNRAARRTGTAVEWGGMAMFVDQAVAGDDPRLERVYRHFAANLRGIVQAGAAAGVPTLLCTPVANLKDCAPLLSLHRPGLAGAELARWQAAFDQGVLAWRLHDRSTARSRLAEALQLDPHYADTEFLLGKLDLDEGRTETARRHFVSALGWDALRFRPDPRIAAIVRETAGQFPQDVRLVDAALALGSDPASRGPIAGREWLFEHVHFDWPGNYQVARLVAEAAAGLLDSGRHATPGWLSSAACADALAYTPHERLPMLMRMEVLVRKPPFNHQLTYVQDEARLNQAIAASTAAMHSAATLNHAAAVADAALQRDPSYPPLAGIRESIAAEQGDWTEALRWARRAQAGTPRELALSADEASLWLHAGKPDEAARALAPWNDRNADRDLLAPIFLAYWTQSGRLAEGLKTVDDWMTRNPSDRRLQLVRGTLRQALDDSAGAESEFRKILRDDPGNEEALQSLVSLLETKGRAEDAAQLSLQLAPAQPRNQDNDLRAARRCDSQNHEQESIRWLEAAERCGPVTSTFELSLALKYYRQKQFAPVLGHLAEAADLSRLEGNPSVSASIEQLIGRMQREAAVALH
jgi:tetratricopeptide (TPR) repeat protein